MSEIAEHAYLVADIAKSLKAIAKSLDRIERRFESVTFVPLGERDNAKCVVATFGLGRYD